MFCVREIGSVLPEPSTSSQVSGKTTPPRVTNELRCLARRVQFTVRGFNCLSKICFMKKNRTKQNFNLPLLAIEGFNKFARWNVHLPEDLMPWLCRLCKIYKWALKTIVCIFDEITLKPLPKHPRLRVWWPGREGSKERGHTGDYSLILKQQCEYRRK